jgi:starvation-inducible DNA-binding protein
MYVVRPAEARRRAGSANTLAVLEQLLIQSIRLRDLYVNVRRDMSGTELQGIRNILNGHLKEQLTLIRVLIDRIRSLGGAAKMSGTGYGGCIEFAGVRGRGALHHSLCELLEAHEAVLRAGVTHKSPGGLQGLRDFAVGQVVLANEQQWEAINAKLSSAGPQQRLIETAASRLSAWE